MSDLSTSEWPHWDALTPTFKSSFSSINEEVYETAREIWPHALDFAHHRGLDASDALQAFLKAVESVSKTSERRGNSEGIKSLPRYLFRTYQRAIWKTVNDEKHHESLDAINEDIASHPDVAGVVENVVLLGEIVARMDVEVLRVFELLILGYSFEEIGHKAGIKPNVIRARFSREVHRLARQVTAVA